MHVTNTLTEYGIISKALHWLSAIILFIQIPLGFYLVDLDFGEQRITIEDIHVTLGLTIFYIIIIRLINNILNPTPKLDPSIFKGQRFLAKMNHVLLYVAILAIINGLITSIILETIILMTQNFNFVNAFKTACGMSLISMISMEIMMNLTDYVLTGGAILTWWVVPIMLIVGFLTPWPYNYWRLKKFGIACH